MTTTNPSTSDGQADQAQDGAQTASNPAGAHEEHPAHGPHAAGADADPSNAAAAPPDEQPARVLMSLRKIADQLAADLGSNAPAHITLKRWSATGELATARHPDPLSPDRRSLYDLHAVRAIVMDRMATRFVEPPAAPAPGFHGALGRAADATPAAELRQLDARLTDIAAQVAALAPALASAVAAAAAQPTPAAPAIDAATLLGTMQQLRAAVAEQSSALNAAVTRIERRLDTIESANKSAAELSRAAGDLEHTRKSLMARYDGELTALRQRLQTMEANSAGRSSAAVDHTLAQLQRAVSRLENLEARAARTPLDSAQDNSGTPISAPAPVAQPLIPRA